MLKILLATAMAMAPIIYVIHLPEIPPQPFHMVCESKTPQIKLDNTTGIMYYKLYDVYCHRVR